MIVYRLNRLTRQINLRLSELSSADWNAWR